MSYDISLMMDTGAGLKQIADCGNYTYNVSAMFMKAFGDGGIHNLADMQAGTAIPFIKGAIDHMRNNAEDYRKLNPKNGWGSYEGAIGYLESILGHCKEHPLTTIQID